jgi:actin related protein 2/3 complex subunit 1A/1B
LFFVGDRSKVALCPNNNEVHIYKKSGSSFTRETVLKEHDAVVTGIDWAPQSNTLVTCSQDRNAYVWTLQGNRWTPTLVILRINRAATSVKWSPNEDKFAVASGAKCVSICYFEEDNDWWVSKHIRKHKSTVTSVDWHPNNVYIATGATDFKCRVFSALVDGLDNDPGAGPFPGQDTSFGGLLAEYASPGWVHDVAWSPTGQTLAYASHDSSVNFVDIGSQQIQNVTLSGLPLRSILFVADDKLVGAGHDCQPFLFTWSNGWSVNKSLDSNQATQKKSQTATRRAFGMFSDMVDRGQTGSSTTLNTKHQNAICEVRRLQGNSFSSTGIDGRIVVWNC